MEHLSMPRSIIKVSCGQILLSLIVFEDMPFHTLYCSMNDSLTTPATGTGYRVLALDNDCQHDTIVALYWYQLLLMACK